MLKTLYRALVVASIALVSVIAQRVDAQPVLDDVNFSQLPTCNAVAEGRTFWVKDNSAASGNCAAGGGSKAICTCDGSNWVVQSGSGGSGSNSFETINMPSGTDPVADSGTDTLNVTCTAPMVCTGTAGTDTADWSIISGTVSRCARFDGTGALVVAAGDCANGDTDTNTAMIFDADDDGANESNGVTELATINDNGQAITEVSADKVQIDVAKLRPPSVLNPRPTPHANDCEFSSGICGSWTLDGGYASGTFDPTAQVSGGDIYDCSTWPGWCFFQDYTAASGSTYKAAVYMAHTPAAEETWWFHVSAAGGVGGTNENRIGLCYLNTGDSNEEVCMGYHSAGGQERVELYVNNNAAVTPVCAMAVAGPGVDGLVFVLRRDGDVYSGGIVRPDGGGGYIPLTANTNAYYCGSVTKTGVTTFDRIALVLGDSNDNPTPGQAVDFIRYEDALTFAVLNE